MTQLFRYWACGLIFIASCFFSNCANIVPPGGGPRDTIPPVLVDAYPLDSSLHFKSKKVTFHFNEYVELDNIIDKMIVSPTLKRTPTVTAKLRTITMEIKDTLEANTTYTFHFADAVKDVNERNPIEDFQYVVSTGDYLDSLNISGKLVVAETGKVDSNVAVMLYRHTQDSVVSKEKPVYYAKSKGDGSYRFKNLAPGSYKLFALKEEDRDLQYTQPTELIGFADSLIHLGTQNLKDVDLLLFGEADTTLIKKPEENAEEAEPEKKDKDKKKPRLYVSAALEGGQQELTGPLMMTFTIPVKSLDSTQLELTEDTLFTPINFTHSFDSTRTKLSIFYKWKEGTPYRLITAKTAPTDTLGQQLTKADTTSFTSKKRNDYGKIQISLTISDSTRNANHSDSLKYIVQLVKDKEIKYTGDVSKGIWKQELLQPGEYEIRLLIDENGNGKWDRGVYYGSPKKQPERVVSYPNKINLKANWGVNEKIAI